ncbi:hypothetical protein TCARB_1714 [Thermofilum adornatum 1505]|uniref:Uncharacterized protein n=1 Tax=Thermofilum adornatum 1505 TaxID=697581 RepID=A0A3G1AA32_9CREN|nr:hypothetical protein TCARB_1714 [Thermofilum adornatum 1505]
MGIVRAPILHVSETNELKEAVAIPIEQYNALPLIVVSETNELGGIGAGIVLHVQNNKEIYFGAPIR